MTTKILTQHISIVTLFADLFTNWRELGVVGRALQKKLVGMNFYNPRDYTKDSYGKVDDAPFGGGCGMVMKYEPIVAALRAAQAAQGKSFTIYLSPQGERLHHKHLPVLGGHSHLVFLCGRYEGIDERIIEHHVDMELSLGDFVLSGGELAAMVVIEALLRLRPGVLGSDESAENDTFSNGLLKCKQYTRPSIVDGFKVPEVLLSGDHKAVDIWRKEQSLIATQRKRPDLLK